MATDTLIDYAELLQQLQDDPNAVTDEQLTDADAAIRARLAELRTATAEGMNDEQYEEIIRLGEQLERVETANGERQQAADERTARARAVLDGVTDPEGGEGAEGEGEGEGGEGTGEEQPEGAEPDAVSAAARRPGMGQMSNRGGAPGPRTESRARVTLTAAADVRGFAAGQEIQPSDVPTALANRLESIRGVRGRRGGGGDGDFLHVVRFNAEIPKDRTLRVGNLVENTRTIERFSGPQSLTAAGTCAPFTVDYGIDVIGVTDEPIKAAVPGFGAERGGVQVRRDMDAAGAGPISATGEWTLEDSANVGTANPPDPKPVWRVPCYPFVEAEVRAFTLQLEFDNAGSKFDPESARAAEEAALIAHARYCENERLRTLLNGSTQVLVPDQISAVIDLLVALDKMQARLRWRLRLADTMKLRHVLPRWVKDLIRSDLTRGMRTASLEALAIADATIEQWFASRNVVPVWHLDGLPASTTPAVASQQWTDANPGTTIQDFPDVVDSAIYPEGAWKRLDAGTLDLGVIRDHELVENNLFRTFTESWEQLFLKGIKSYRMTAELNPTGLSAGTLDTSQLAG